MDLDALPVVALQLGLAALAGGLIGVQRAASGKVAGVRTHILICVGSALFMQISEAVAAGEPTRWADPGRVASQVVVGVGFLGAGSIIRSGFTVAGLTSAATIWVVAALGLACGSGLYVHLAVGTAVSLMTLDVLPRLFVASLPPWRSYNVMTRDEEALLDVRRGLEDEGVEVQLTGFERDDSGSMTADLLIRLDQQRADAFEDRLLADPRVLRCASPTSR